MSSHFSRIIYDKKCSDERYGESIAPGNYNLFDGQVNNSKTCHASNGPRANSNSRSNVYGCSLEGRTAFESELRNITESFQRNKDITLNQKNARTDLLKNNNTCLPNQECPTCYVGQECKCDFQQTNYSRLNNSIDNFRELSTQYLNSNLPSGRYYDDSGTGLHIYVRKSGSKSWSSFTPLYGTHSPCP